MTATIIRLYRDMPRELSRADLDRATDAHVATLRPTQAELARAHDCLIEVQEMRHKRPTQQQVLDAAMIKHTRRLNREIIAYGAAISLAFALALTIGHATTSAWTAHNAAALAD